MPKPKKPIQNPLIQGSLISGPMPNLKAIRAIKNANPSKFLKVIREKTPQVSKRLFAAGKPNENNPTATTQLRLPENTELCDLYFFRIEELNTIKPQSLIAVGLKYLIQPITRLKPTLSSRLSDVK